MDEVNSIAAWQMGVWMSKHGKVTLQPKVTLQANSL